MGRRKGPFATHNPWRKIALNVCFWLTAFTFVFGFVVLPIADRGHGESMWTAICSSFGLQNFDTGKSVRPAAVYASNVSWTPREVASVKSGDAHKGEFVALDCALCHGERGLSHSAWVPNLAGMRRETMVKQLLDFNSGHRVYATMNAIGKALSRADMEDVAAYYSLQAAFDKSAEAHASADRTDSLRSTDPTVRLVFAGDASRGIAPCGSCHGFGGLKRAAPVLAGQQVEYLERQLTAFQLRTRSNDEGEQMRVVAAKLRPQEVKALARYLSTNVP